MVDILVFVVVVALLGVAAYFLCYGGWNGPVDWAMHTIVHGDRDRARVALTFDDGPDPARTPALLDALAELGVKATFFVIGAEVDAHPALCARIAAEGHEIGNHTYTHRYLPIARTRRVARELAATDRAITAATGVTTTLARPPWGGRAPWTVRAFGNAAKRVVLWDVNSFDWKGAPAAEVTQRVLDRARPGSIILMHDARDGGEVTIEAVRLLVPQLRARGYELVTVTGSLASAA
jgi:peptidoglycan/xylan/chitin deacetylase (PgdA/CDA1 family)